MCYSAEVSLVTLLVGLIGSAFVYTLGSEFDRIAALFIGYVSLMQGIELVLWNHQKCDTFHKKISVLGMLLNLGQPIVLGLLTLLISSRKEYRIEIIGIMILYSAYCFYLFNSYNDNLQCTQPRANDPHLVWNWTILDSWRTDWAIYIIVACLISILGMPTFNQGLLFAGALFFSMITSIIVYPRQDMGAMWCFFSALSPPIYYFLRKNGLKLP
jgi:hypothetical protein